MIEVAFLSELDAEGILPNLKEKVRKGDPHDAGGRIFEEEKLERRSHLSENES